MREIAKRKKSVTTCPGFPYSAGWSLWSTGFGYIPFMSFTIFAADHITPLIDFRFYSSKLLTIRNNMLYLFTIHCCSQLEKDCQTT